MQLIPPVSAVRLRGAPSGSLVKSIFGESASIGLIAIEPGPDGADRGIVYLTGPDAARCPTFRSLPGGDSTVGLTYGSNYAFNALISARIVMPQNPDFELIGAMLVGPAAVEIRVRVVGQYDAMMFYNIATGVCGPSSQSIREVVAVLDWELRLTTTRPSDLPFLTFSA